MLNKHSLPWEIPNLHQRDVSETWDFQIASRALWIETLVQLINTRMVWSCCSSKVKCIDFKQQFTKRVDCWHCLNSVVPFLGQWFEQIGRLSLVWLVLVNWSFTPIDSFYQSTQQFQERVVVVVAAARCIDFKQQFIKHDQPSTLWRGLRACQTLLKQHGSFPGSVNVYS